MATSETKSKSTHKVKVEQQDSDKETKPPKQTTIWIDGDLYEALMIGKAQGHGSLKDQINEAARLLLYRRQVKEWEETERRVWAEKPWDEEDQEELEAWQSIQVVDSEWED